MTTRIFQIKTLLLLLLSAQLLFAQKTVHKGVEFPNGDISFADRVIEYVPGKAVGDPCNNPGESLGLPDVVRYAKEGKSVSLGNGSSHCEGYIVLEFIDNYLIDIEGIDLYIFEVGKVEATELYIGNDLKDWIYVGKIEGSTKGVDIGKAFKVKKGDRFKYVRLCDFPDGNKTKHPNGGADIDAVGAIGTVFRPESERPETTSNNDKKGTEIKDLIDDENCTGDDQNLQIEDRAGKKNTIVEVPLNACHFDGVGNLDLNLKYNPEIADLIDIDKGDINRNAFMQWNEPVKGKIKISMASSRGISGSGPIALLSFKLHGKKGTSTIVSGSVPVSHKDPGSKIKLYVTPGTLKIIDDSMIIGDCDRNGRLDESDAIMALKISVEKEPLDLCYDVNRDGYVNSLDARMILKAIVGAIKLR